MRWVSRANKAHKWRGARLQSSQNVAEGHSFGTSADYPATLGGIFLIT